MVLETQGNMAFKPVNSDHSVTSATFQLQFAAPLSNAVLDGIRASGHLWQQHLPAVSSPKNFHVELDASGPRMSGTNGVEFAFLRPDGTPAWAMRVFGNMAVVECSRYTRWANVFAQAKDHLRAFVTVAAGIDPEPTVVETGLTMADDFLWFGDRSDYALEKLLAHGPLVADQCFLSGPVWHSNVGWFEKNAKDNADTLQLLNVIGLHSDDLCILKRADARVAIQHVQNYRQPLKLDSLSNSFEDIFTSVFEQMHVRNKSLLQEILAPEVAREIGLK